MVDQVSFSSSYWLGGSGDFAGTHWALGYFFDSIAQKETGLVTGTHVSDVSFSNYLPDLLNTVVSNTTGTLTGVLNAKSVQFFYGSYRLNGQITATDAVQVSQSLSVSGAGAALTTPMLNLSAGNLTIEDGGLVSLTGSFWGLLYWSSPSGPGSSVTVTGGGSKLQIAGTADVGGSSGPPAVTGTISITNGGSASIASLSIDDQGSVSVSGSGSTLSDTSVLLCGNSTLTVAAGAQINTRAMYVGGNASISGARAVTISGAGSQLSVNAAANTTAFLSIAAFDSCSVAVTAGGTLSIASPGFIAIGSTDSYSATTCPAGSGLLSIDGQASKLLAPILMVGVAATGTTFSVSNSATATLARYVTLSSVPDSTSAGTGQSIISVKSGGAVEIGGSNGAVANTVLIDLGGYISGNGLIDSDITGTVAGTSIPTYSLTITDNGTQGILADQGTLAVHANVTGSGTVGINPKSTLELGGTCSNSVSFVQNGTAASEQKLVIDNAAGFSGVISGLADGDEIDFPNANITAATLALTANSDGTTNLFLSGADGTKRTLRVKGQYSLVGNHVVCQQKKGGGTDLTLESDADLAALDQLTYGTGTCPAYYSLVPSLSYLDSSNGFYAQTYENSLTNELVVAIRGTNMAGGLLSGSFIKNLLEDTSFITGSPTFSLLAEVGAAVDYLRNVVAWAKSFDSGGQITLTGHSLGGAIAQMLGKASGYTTIAFDAPGAGSLYLNLGVGDFLLPVFNLSGQSGNENTNYRMSGDQVSLAGTAMGTTITVSDPWTANHNSISDLENVLTYHDIGVMKQQLSVSQQNSWAVSFNQGTGGDPNLSSVIAAAAKIIATYTPQGRWIAKFAPVVDALATVLFDPAQGSHFVFSTDPGSPNIASVTLPASPGLAKYTFSYRIGTTWSTPTTVAPGAVQSLAAGVDAIQFTALNSSNAVIQIPSGFLFETTFSKSGTVFATLAMGTPAGDFSGDNSSDILLRNPATGTNYIWAMNGTSIASGSETSTFAGTGWTPVATGDFDGDGKADILLQSPTGHDLYVWLMNGASVQSGSGAIGTNPGASWQIAATGDFNGDGKTDVLLHNASTGQNYIWMMNGDTIGSGSGETSTVVGTDWQIAGTGDFNGDGKTDILLQSASTHMLYIWTMNGTSVQSSSGAISTNPGTSWQVAGTGDFDGDGKTDILLHNSVTGDNYIWLMNGTSIGSGSGSIPVSTGTVWSPITVGDYNGDGKSDILLQNSTTHELYAWMMSGTSVLSGSGSIGTNPGTSWQVFAGPGG